MANGLKDVVPTLILTGIGGSIVGAIGAIIVRELFPSPEAGDGFKVVWITADFEAVTELEFGNDEKGALEKAIEIKKKAPAGTDVSVKEVRQGIVVDTVKAGSARKLEPSEVF